MTLFANAKFLKNKTAIITGANRGIGKAICETFLDHGAHVIGCVRNQNDITKQWQQEAELAGAKLSLINLDLSDEPSIKDSIKKIRQISKEVDILVNCAGIADGAVFQMTSLKRMREIFEVNLFNQISLCQGVSRLMARQKSGVIVNISSSTSHVIDHGTMAYGTSKAAFERVTLSMAVELAAQGIRVNGIAPGVTDTDMAEEMDPQAKEKLLEKSLLKSIANPYDIANSALFLCSGLSSHITGQIINVDGGII